MPSQNVATSQAPSPESNATSVADSSISLASFITAHRRILGNDAPHCRERRHPTGHHAVAKPEEPTRQSHNREEEASGKTEKWKQ